MPKSFSGDLRERVIEAVQAGASRREAAERFEISASCAVKWLPARLLRDHQYAAAKGRSASQGGFEPYLCISMMHITENTKQDFLLRQ
jgi:hypothetical protein